MVDRKTVQQISESGSSHREAFQNFDKFNLFNDGRKHEQICLTTAHIEFERLIKLNQIFFSRTGQIEKYRIVRK